EKTFLSPAGDVRVLRTYLPHQGPEGIEGLVLVAGRSERKRAMVDRLTLLHALSTALTLAENSEARSDFLLVHCMDFLSAEAGAVAIVEPDRGPGLWITAKLGEMKGLAAVGERLDGSVCPLLTRAFEDRWPQLERDDAGWVRALS